MKINKGEPHVPLYPLLYGQGVKGDSMSPVTCQNMTGLCTFDKWGVSIIKIRVFGNEGEKDEIS
jgi:hypothetical protein